MNDEVTKAHLNQTERLVVDAYKALANLLLVENKELQACATRVFGEGSPGARLMEQIIPVLDWMDANNPEA